MSLSWYSYLPLLADFHSLNGWNGGGEEELGMAEGSMAGHPAIGWVVEAVAIAVSVRWKNEP